MATIDSFGRFNLDLLEFDAYGVPELKCFCNSYGRRVEVNNEIDNGYFNARVALLQCKLNELNLIPRSYHCKDVKNPTIRINGFWMAISKSKFYECVEFGKVIKLILIEAA